ncbi:transposase, IS630 family [Candidatus Thiomargarita nelsonii]|uniref:Transposase, IS630 family n=1 Tax=Candidatus Thiomargarita nelsonii TaxID=1003181 RepID=A0A0A6NYA0_9GAMM|nr:transposase, IS630 family [Candidatus Thiomargarita nelsonii]
MIKIEFSQNEINQLRHDRYYYPEPRVQRKIDVLLLKSQGIAHNKIAEIVGICPNTLRSYLREYQSGGLDKLKEVNFYQPQSALRQHRQTLDKYFREHPVASINEAIAKIEELTGIKRSPTRVRHFLKSIGLKCQKVGMIPSKADPDAQESFKKNELEPRLAEAQQGKRAVFFVDAAHFVLAPFLGFLWTFTRIFIKAPASRKRFKVLGALNAINHELIRVTNDSYINAQSVCKLLKKIAALNLGVPITLVLDNARYQKCRLVQELAISLDIELLYIPPYSPNLNLIERLWKFVKKKCLYSKYYSDFALFKAAIIDCLVKTHTTHKKELDSLLTLKFQSFKKAQFVKD